MKKLKIFILILIIFCILSLSLYIIINYNVLIKEEKNDFKIDKENIKTTTNIKKIIKDTSIIINAIGDCTIGYDDNFGYSKSFNEVYKLNGDNYFFDNVKKLFVNDDLTVANLEGTFTESNLKREKKFNFKAPKHYINILSEGSIDVVNIANNHIYDYNEIGYLDTINTLNDAKINYFGFDDIYIYEKAGIKLGFAGIYCIEDRNCVNKIDSAIKKLEHENVNTIILSFHWGIEKSYKQSDIQKYLAHYAIDNGAELVLGHHPHVLQGIELYKDKYVVYSLANFVFGGNKNPKDKDTMIFNVEFKYKEDVLNETIVNIYPASVSSKSNINDYKPILLSGEEYDRVIKKIEENSIGITFS